jgi:hypothetical protein
MNIIDLGKLINPEELVSYINVAEQLETVIHKYGTEFIFPEYPCWIEYKNEGNIEGSISFTRHTDKHPVLLELVKRMSAILRPIFPEKYAPEENRIHILRTIGDIPIHRDESSRLTCINIGLKNSSGAITYIGNGGEIEDFKKNHTSTILKDGHGYLVNTYEFHSVKAISSEPRYLITYGVGVKIDYFKKFLRTGEQLC